MAVYYAEFDSTLGQLPVDLRSYILANPDWSYQGYTTSLTTTTAVANASATSLTFSSGSLPSAVIVGSMLRIGDYGSGVAEFRKVTAVTATTVTVAALTYAHPVGTSIYWGNEVYKTTTVRGSNMIVDLTYDNPNLARLAMATYGGWTAPTGTTAGVSSLGVAPKFIYMRAQAGALANPVHVIISSSKDHLYINVEGPRGSESGTNNGAYGSTREYFFIADLVPYSTSDTTPVVVSGGRIQDTPNSDWSYGSHICTVSQSLNGLQYWVQAKLVSLQFLAGNYGNTIGVQRYTTADDEFYLAPLVVAADDCGFRGRLNNLYIAGFNFADNADGVYPMVGARVTYDGIEYELQSVNKGDALGNWNTWGSFGAVTNSSSSTYWRSVVAAIPVGTI